MRPDALMLPEAVKLGDPHPSLPHEGGGSSGGRIFDRIAAVAVVAEPLLEADRSAGERAYIRKQPHGRLFITRDPADTIFFPTDHPRSGQQRYRWVRQADGTEIGYLTDGGADAV